jgi:hypothetical protein
MVGLLSVQIGQLQLSLSLAVGVLLSGLVMGHLRRGDPRFGRVPEASLWLFDMLGLTAFLALVGLASGPAVVPALKNAGLMFVVGAVVVAIVPHVVTISSALRHAHTRHPARLCRRRRHARAGRDPGPGAEPRRSATACLRRWQCPSLWGTVTVTLLGP